MKHKYLTITLTAILLVMLLFCGAAAAVSISSTTVTNTNVYAGSSQYDIAPSGYYDSTTTTSGITHVSGRYIYATGMTASPNPAIVNEEVTFTVTGQQGATVLDRGTYAEARYWHSFGDDSSSASNKHEYSAAGTYQPIIYMQNPGNTNGITINGERVEIQQHNAEIYTFTPTPAYGSTSASVYVLYSGMTGLSLDVVLLNTNTVIGQNLAVASGDGYGTYTIPVHDAAQYSQDGKPVFLTLRAYDSSDPTNILATALYTYVPTDYNNYYAELKLENAYQDRYYVTGDKPKITAYYYLPDAMSYLTLRTYLEIYNPTTGEIHEQVSLQQHATYPNGYSMITPGETNVGQFSLEYTSSVPTAGDYKVRLTHYESGTFESEHLVLAETDFYILTVVTPSGALRIPNAELIYDTSTIDTSTNSAAIFYDYYNMPFGGKIEVINTNTNEKVHTQELSASVEREGLNFRYRPTEVPPLGAAGNSYQAKMTPYQSDGTEGTAVATKTFTVLREAPEATITVSPQTINPGESVTVTYSYENFVNGATIEYYQETAQTSTADTVGDTYSGSGTKTYTPVDADTYYTVKLLDGTEVVATDRFYVNPYPAEATLIIAPPRPEPGNIVTITYDYENFKNGAAKLYVTPSTPGTSTITYNLGDAAADSGSVQYTTSNAGNEQYTVTIKDGTDTIQTVTFTAKPKEPAATIAINPQNPTLNERVTISYSYTDFLNNYAYMAIAPDTLLIDPTIVQLGTASDKTGTYRYLPSAAGISYTVKIYDGQFAQTPIAQTTFAVSNSSTLPISPETGDFWNMQDYDGSYEVSNYVDSINWMKRLSVPTSLVNYFEVSTPDEYRIEHGMNPDDAEWFDDSVGSFIEGVQRVIEVLFFPIRYIFNATYGVIFATYSVFGWATAQLSVPVMIISAVVELIPDELMNVALLLFGFDIFFLLINVVAPGIAGSAGALGSVLERIQRHDQSKDNAKTAKVMSQARLLNSNKAYNKFVDNMLFGDEGKGGK